MRSTDIQGNIREKFDDYLRRNKKRRTAERFAILEMSENTQGHFTAESLGEMLRSKGFPVSSATVYATLDLLVDFGFLLKQRFANHACLYEKASMSAASTHHHLICNVCGKIKEVRDPLLCKSIEERRFPGFSQSYYTLTIYGVCNACTRKKNKELKKKA